MKTITILMSTYNGEKFLNKQLDSIKKQVLPENVGIKIIVRDDGSTDNTLNILEKWKNCLSLEIIEGKNVGARESFYWLIMNSGNSDYYALCDQDDIWKEDKLISAIEKIDSGYDMYFTNVEYIDVNDKRLDQYLLREDFKLSLKRVFMCNPANGCTMVWNNKINKRLKTVKYDTFTMHDEYLCTVGLVCGKVYYDKNASMYYRVHQNNVTQSDGIKKKFKIWKSIWFGRSEYQIDNRAKELLKIESSDENRKVLEELSNYKSGLNRFGIIKRYKCEDRGIQRSFRIRMILKII